MPIASGASVLQVQLYNNARSDVDADAALHFCVESTSGDVLLQMPVLGECDGNPLNRTNNKRCVPNADKHDAVQLSQRRNINELRLLIRRSLRARRTNDDDKESMRRCIDRIR